MLDYECIFVISPHLTSFVNIRNLYSDREPLQPADLPRHLVLVPPPLRRPRSRPPLPTHLRRLRLREEPTDREHCRSQQTV